MDEHGCTAMLSESQKHDIAEKEWKMSAHSGFYRVFQAQCCDSKCCKQFCNLGYQHLNMINTIKKNECMWSILQHLHITGSGLMWFWKMFGIYSSRWWWEDALTSCEADFNLSTNSSVSTKSLFMIILNFIFTCDINCVVLHIKIHWQTWLYSVLSEVSRSWIWGV